MHARAVGDQSRGHTLPTTRRDVRQRPPMGPESALDWRSRCRLVGPRASRWRLPRSDVALTIVCLVTMTVEVDFLLQWGPHPAYLTNVVLIGLIVLAQPLRHLRVVTSFALTYSALAGLALLVWLSPVNLGLSPILVTAPTALHCVTRWAADRRWGTAALLLALVGSVLNPVVLRAVRASTDTAARGGPLLFSTACVLTVTASYLLASSARRQAEERDRAVAAAALEAASRAAAEAALATNRAVAAERLTIARELHDLVGHGLTVVSVHAGTGLALDDAEQMRQSLLAIRRASATSLASVRELVSVLRGPSDTPTRAPLADLTHLPGLIDQAREAGLALKTELPARSVLESWNGTWTALQRLTLSRLLTEGTTNAVRHGGSRARLDLQVSEGACTVVLSNTLPDDARPIDDASPAAPAAGASDAAAWSAGPPRHTGSGLAGLGERLRLAGGTLDAGVEEVDGEHRFVLRASFPVYDTTDVAVLDETPVPRGPEMSPIDQAGAS